jgi:tripartite-type tricarboxylate transporter receptor subunit TctC
MQQRSRRAFLKAAPAAALFPAIARAKETWPTRPIRCIVPLPPGGGTDAVARLAMQHLSEALGVAVVVDNKPGAGGTIGSDVVAHAAPDGYTFGIATSSSHAAAPVFRKDLPYDPVTSFTAVTLLGTTPYVLIAGPAAGAKDLPGFIAAAKAQPRKLVCASLGISTLGYLLTRQFELIAGVELVDAPYKGSGQAYPDLMNGTVAVMLDNPTGSAGLVRENRLTALAVTQPSAALPDVPTFDSLGVKPFDDVFWYGLVAPVGLPAEIAQRVQQTLAQGFLADPGRAKMRALDATPVFSAPEAFAATMARDTRKWRDLADRLGIKPE